VSVTANRLLELVEAELAELKDDRVNAHVRGLLVPPVSVVRDWDYGAEDEAYPCWSVLEHATSNTGIAYCEYGFGPTNPWGLVFLAGKEHRSMGMDAGWFPRFLDAYFESSAATELPIWRVFQSRDDEFPGQPLTVEGSRNATWAEVERLRAVHPGTRFHCNQGVYRREA
jgi:hypothetical protein